MPAFGQAPIPDKTDFGAVSTPDILESMLRSQDHVSDLIFSPGRVPQVETHEMCIRDRHFALLSQSARLSRVDGGRQYTGATGFAVAQIYLGPGPEGRLS